MSSWIAYPEDLFIMKKVCVELVTLLEQAKNRKMVKQIATDALEQRSSGF